MALASDVAEYSQCRQISKKYSLASNDIVILPSFRVSKRRGITRAADLSSHGITSWEVNHAAMVGSNDNRSARKAEPIGATPGEVADETPNIGDAGFPKGGP